MAFFKCKNCKQTWQYPIEKCPECFIDLERVRSKKIKVVGTAKVLIPSIFHSKIPYFVLVLEDENGNKWLQKSEKEYRIGEEFIGEEFIIKNQANEKTVAVWNVKYDFLEAVEKVIGFLGDIKVTSASKILLLPTLEKVSHPYFRDNTSPEFLKAVLDFLFIRGANPQNIKVVSQSFDDVDIGVKAMKSGLLDVCQNYKVLPFDLRQGNFIKRGRLEISEEIFVSDLIINLPILKIGQTQSIKNLFFLLKKENFLAEKYLYSEKEIFEKLKVELPKILTIAEANHIQDEKGFTHYLNLIFASFNPQNIDRVFFKIVGNKKIPDLLTDIEIENIPIVGKEINEINWL